MTIVVTVGLIHAFTEPLIGSPSGHMAVAAAAIQPEPPSPSRRLCSATPAVVIALVAVGAAFLLNGSGQQADHERADSLRDLQARSATDYAAALQLGRWHTLSAINSTLGPALPRNDTDAQLAAVYLHLAAQLSPDACEPVLARARLLFAMGLDDDAADDLHRARTSSSCAAQADLYLAYIDEFAGFIDKAKASFYAARELSGGGVHENFYERAYDYTDPALAPDQYDTRLRKLITFRDALEEIQIERSDAIEFLRPTTTKTTTFGADVEVRAGAANLEAARRKLSELDFVVLRAFLTPWEVAQLHGFYADLIRDNVVANFDAVLSRTTTYNDRVGHWLGQRLTALLNRVTDQPAKHVYSFLCWHRVVDPEKRPVLKPHTDREDNDWTVSIQLHYDDDGRTGSWPIWVHKPRRDLEKAGWQALPPRSESVRIVLQDGDAVVFRGRRHIHWRDPMPDEGRSYSSLLLHYVPLEFDWRDFKFVRQKDDPTI